VLLVDVESMVNCVSYHGEVYMSFEHVNQNLKDFVKSAQCCLEEGWILPSLALIYSTMDALAYLDLPPDRDEVEGEDFIKWVETYLLPDSALPCTGADLYGARCGVLHSQSPKSRRSRKGTARELWYAWGEVSVAEMQAKADSLGRGAIAIHVQDLLRALVAAENKFGTQLNQASDKAAKVAWRAQNLFAGVTGEYIRGTS
jgi:hypothetical protein